MEDTKKGEAEREAEKNQGNQGNDFSQEDFEWF